MGKKNKWWKDTPPKFKYKIPKSRMEKDGRGWRVKKSEEELDDEHTANEFLRRKRETELWAKYLDGRTFT
tara:strand:+ start:423 stop:632 length:210 start_codon:yes stop_codon:yes gene_type:complete